MGIRDRMLERIKTLRAKKYESRVGFGIDFAWITPSGLLLDAKLHPSKSATAEDGKWLQSHMDVFGRALRDMFEHDLAPAVESLLAEVSPDDLPAATEADCWEAFRVSHMDVAFASVGVAALDACSKVMTKRAVDCVTQSKTPEDVDACRSAH